MGKKIGLMALLVLGLAALPVFADGITFTVNGTYDLGTPTTAFSAPGDTFSLTFTEPSLTVSANGTSVPVTFTLDSATIPVPSGFQVSETFSEKGQGGLFDVQLINASKTGFTWMLSGDALGTLSGSNFNLNPPPGTFTIDPTQSEFDQFVDAETVATSSFTGTVTTSAAGTAVPEPPAAALLLGGLLGLAALGFRKRAGRASAA